MSRWILVENHFMFPVAAQTVNMGSRDRHLIQPSGSYVPDVFESVLADVERVIAESGGL